MAAMVAEWICSEQDSVLPIQSSKFSSIAGESVILGLSFDFFLAVFVGSIAFGMVGYLPSLLFGIYNALYIGDNLQC